MDFHCFICKKSAEHTCLHATQPLHLCKSHFSVYETSNLEYHKGMQPSSKATPKADVLQNLEKIIQAIKHLESISEELIKILQEFINIGIKVSSQLKISIKNLEKKIKFIMSGQFENASKIKIHEELERFTELSIPEPELKFYNLITQILSPDKEQKPYKTKLFYGVQGKNELMEFDTVSLKTTKHELINSPLLGIRSAMCEIADNMLFSSGGMINNKLISSTFFINLATKTIKSLPEPGARGGAAALYYKDSIYIFGGHTRASQSTSAKRFLVNECLWKDISDLPQAVKDTSTLLLNERVLISGKPNFMEVYELEKNSYSSVSHQFSIEYSNLLIQDESSIILLTRENVYYCESLSLDSWTQTSRKYNFQYAVCKPVVRKRFAYFADSKGDIFAFDLDLFQISVIER